MTHSIKAVVFDSGHTLVKPLSGEWFPGWSFADILTRHGHSVPGRDQMDCALPAGAEFLENNHDVQNLDEELAQFSEYYRIVLDQLDINPRDRLIDDLASTMVHQPNFEPYEETREVLDQLQTRGLPMGVITDAWPSVATKYEQLGFAAYFTTIVISSIQRCTKPHPDMFGPVLEELDVAPQEVLFIDDISHIVTEARRLGFEAVLIDRDRRARGMPAISDLWGLFEFL